MKFSFFQIVQLAPMFLLKRFIQRKLHAQWIGILFFEVVLILFSAFNAVCATYYIDYASGSDSNNGTSTNTPWRLCPGMNGFSGSYSHSAGDVFIFKGGDTWVNADFPFTIANSGSSTDPDTYESVSNWFTGASYTKPCFDLQDTWNSTQIFTRYSAIFVTGSYIVISGLEIKNLFIPNSTNYNAFGVASIQGYQNTTNLTVQNCYIHDWKAGGNIASTNTADIAYTDSDYGGVFSQGLNTIVQRCVIGPGIAPLNMVGGSGCGIYGAQIAQSNIVIGCPEFINGDGTNISYNTLINGTNSYDPENHANAIYHVCNNNQTVYIFNNVINSLDTTFQTMLLHPGWTGATNSTYYLYNNVVWNVSSPVDIDESGVTISNSATSAHLYNNTIQDGICVGIVKRGLTYHLTELDCENNLWVSDTVTYPIGTAATTSAYAPVGTLIDTNNVWLSTATATADGYTAANMYAPTSVGNPTVNAGANLASLGLFTNDVGGVLRPSLGPWSIGAFQLTSIAPFISVSASPATVTNGQPTTLTWSSVNATNMTLSGFGSVPLNGSTNIIAPHRITYTLTATGTNGATSANVSIKVLPQPPSALGLKPN